MTKWAMALRLSFKSPRSRQGLTPLPILGAAMVVTLLEATSKELLFGLYFCVSNSHKMDDLRKDIAHSKS